MRKIICIEDKMTIQNQYLLPGSIKWPEGRIPVTDSNWPRDITKILGQATDLQRDSETGEITADITMADEMNNTILDELGFTIYANEVVWGKDDKLGRTVETATIRHIYIDMNVPWGKFGGAANQKEMKDE